MDRAHVVGAVLASIPGPLSWAQLLGAPGIHVPMWATLLPKRSRRITA